MKASRLLSLAGALGLASLVAAPGLLRAYITLGFSLPIGTSGNGYQRDFRLYNNFQDSSANDNTRPDSNFAGAVGAALAIWKAGDVWCSDSSGDRNFDFDWQSGLAPGPGNLNENTISAASAGTGSCGGGVLMYSEGIGPDGWRIRFC